MYRYAIFPKYSGFPTLQISSIGFFYLLDVLLLLLKENRIFSFFSGKQNGSSCIFLCNLLLTQWTFSCSKLTKETLEQGVKYVQS